MADAQSSEDADEIGRRTVLDLEDDEAAERLDVTPGSDVGEHADDATAHRRRLLDMAREAEALCGKADEKLLKAVKLVAEQLVQEVLVEAGAFEERRRAQQVDWTWSMVRDAVLDRVHNHPRVREIRAEVERQVRNGELTPALGAHRILEAADRRS